MIPRLVLLSLLHTAAFFTPEDTWKSDSSIQILNTATNGDLLVLSSNNQFSRISEKLQLIGTDTLDCESTTNQDFNCNNALPVSLESTTQHVYTVHCAETNCLIITRNQDTDKLRNNSLTLPASAYFKSSFVRMKSPGVLQDLRRNENENIITTYSIVENNEPGSQWSYNKPVEMVVPFGKTLKMVASKETNDNIITIYAPEKPQQVKSVTLYGILTRKKDLQVDTVDIHCGVSRKSDKCKPKNLQAFMYTEVTVSHASFSSNSLTIAVIMSTSKYNFCTVTMESITSCASNINCGEITAERIFPKTYMPGITQMISETSENEWLYISHGEKLRKYIVSSGEIHLSHEWEAKNGESINHVLQTGTKVYIATSSSLYALENPLGCESSQTCFQCLSNPFPWYQTCEWTHGVCATKLSLANATGEDVAACSPVIYREEKQFFYKNNKNYYEMILEGDNFGERDPHVYCSPGNMTDTDLTASGLSEKRRTLTLKVPISMENRQCTISVEKEDTEYGIWVGGSAVIPTPIKFIDVPEKHPNVSPPTVPTTVGFTVTISASKISNGAKCFPKLTLILDTEIMSVSAYNKTLNSASFFFQPIHQYAANLADKSIGLLLELDEQVTRKLGTNLIGVDPTISDISQIISMRSGGIPIIISGRNLWSFQQPILTFKFFADDKRQSTEIQMQPNFQSANELQFESPNLPHLVNSWPVFVNISLHSEKNYKPNENWGFSENILPLDQRSVYYIEDPHIDKIPQPNYLKLNHALDSELNMTFSGIPIEWLDKGFIRVWIGLQECVIQNYTETYLECTVPPYYKVVTQQDVYVQVGHKYRTKIGTFYYEKENTTFLTYISIGASVAFLFVFLFVGGIVFYTMRLKKKDRAKKLEQSRDAGRLLSNIRYNETTELDELDYLIDEEEERVLNTCFTEEDEKKYTVYYRQNRVKPEWIQQPNVKALGEGAFGKVYRMTMDCPLEGEDVCRKLVIAVKFSKEKNPLKMKHTWKELLDEGNSMRDFQHRNILGMLGFSILVQPGPPRGNVPELSIILPYMTDGDLKSYITKNKATLTNRRRLTFSLHAALGMEYLNARGVLHGDLAARNCMLTRLSPGQQDEELVLKVADFGLSKSETSQEESVTNKPVCWCSPEFLRGGKLTTQSDIWAYGVLVWEIFNSGAQPFRHLFQPQERMDLRKVEHCILSGQKPHVDPLIVELAAVREVMDLCWSYNPQDRPLFSDICEQLEEVLCLPSSDSDSGDSPKHRLQTNILAQTTV